jgi:hypothetical protein
VTGPFRHGVKTGVILTGIRPEVFFAWQVACNIWEEVFVPCVISSGREGTHSAHSLHYEGLAIDLRLPSWYGRPVGDDHQVYAALKQELGPLYDVVLEGNHVHVEYQPKPPFDKGYTNA